MNTMRLIQAIAYLALHDTTLVLGVAAITMIEFEDGSGYKFNYTTLSNKGVVTKQFIDLTGKL